MTLIGHCIEELVAGAKDHVRRLDDLALGGRNDICALEATHISHFDILDDRDAAFLRLSPKPGRQLGGVWRC